MERRATNENIWHTQCVHGFVTRLQIERAVMFAKE